MNRKAISVVAGVLALAGCGASTGSEPTQSRTTSILTQTTLAASPTADQTHGKSSSHSTALTVPANTDSIDSITVSKCYTDGATQLLIKASSSDRSAHLIAYRPDGTVIGEVQNGGGSRYGGTVMPPQPSDPVTVTIKSSSGGSITVATTPFQA